MYWWLGLLMLILVGSVLAILALARGQSETGLPGVPAATVIMLLGLWLAPLLLVSALYVRTFDRFWPAQDQLKKLSRKLPEKE